MATPAVFIVNLIAFVFVCFHAVTWFMLVPRVMARQVLGRPTPEMIAAAPNFGVWLVASVVVALFVLRII
jgi:fumarate reductase subunit C